MKSKIMFCLLIVMEGVVSYNIMNSRGLIASVFMWVIMALVTSIIFFGIIPTYKTRREIINKERQLEIKKEVLDTMIQDSLCDYGDIAMSTILNIKNDIE